MSSSPNDLELLQLIMQKDQMALSLLYDRYARIVYSLAYRILANTEEAEEIVLDVFSQVWRSATTYNVQKSRVDTWLFMLTRSRAIDRKRSLVRSARVYSLSGNTIEQLDNSPDAYLMTLERSTQVEAALAKLPREQRETIELAYYLGMTHTEIAAKTGESLGTIKSRLRLGLKKLSFLLKSVWEN